MQGKWRGFGIWLAGWLLSPQVVVAAVTAIVGFVLATLANLPAAVVFLIVLAALIAGFLLAHVALSFYDRLRSRDSAKADGPRSDLCGDPKARLRELAKSAKRLEHHLTHFDNWWPAVDDKEFDGWVDGRHTTHAAAMQTLLFGFARFFSAAWTYEEQCEPHGDWNEVMGCVREVYGALTGDPDPTNDYPLMSEPLHELGERSTPGFGTAEARPINRVEFRSQMADDPRFAEYFEPLRRLLQRARPESPARARLRAVERSVKRVVEGLDETA